MAEVTEHPILGRLIPDQFGEDLMFFRQFKEFKSFWQPNSSKQLEDLEPEHREFVKKWKQQPGGLPEICRNYDVLAALQSLGVYEVGFSSTDDATESLPTEPQLVAWNDFCQQEVMYCENAKSALIRYFNHLRTVEPELFRGESDCPEVAETIEDLTTCVRFDGANLSPAVLGHQSTLSFGWDVDWDMEHGLQMIFHDRQVIAMGNELYSPEDIASQANFYRDVLNAEETDAYEKFATFLAQLRAYDS